MLRRANSRRNPSFLSNKLANDSTNTREKPAFANKWSVLASHTRIHPRGFQPNNRGYYESPTAR